jgi:hypothetical protein
MPAGFSSINHERGPAGQIYLSPVLRRLHSSFERSTTALVVFFFSLPAKRLFLL